MVACVEHMWKTRVVKKINEELNQRDEYCAVCEKKRTVMEARYKMGIKVQE